MATPIIAWPGGKRRLLKHLLSDIPSHHTYAEVFAGGAALLLGKQPSKAEVLNDIDGELVRLYRCVQNHLEEFVRQFRWALASREMFRWLQLQHSDTLTDIQRGARFYYLQRLCFGGRSVSRTYGVDRRQPPRLNLLRIEEELSELHLRLARVTIECLPWEEIIRRYDSAETLFFLDPPYWQVSGYGRAFNWEEYEAIAATLQRLKGKAILTLNDHPDLRPIFRDLRATRVALDYTIGAGARKPAREVIYRTW